MEEIIDLLREEYEKSNKGGRKKKIDSSNGSVRIHKIQSIDILSNGRLRLILWNCIVFHRSWDIASGLIRLQWVLFVIFAIKNGNMVML